MRTRQSRQWTARIKHTANCGTNNNNHSQFSENEIRNQISESFLVKTGAGEQRNERLGTERTKNGMNHKKWLENIKIK